MNLVCIPYHDWRKISREGARTRDAHFLHHLSNNRQIDKVVVVNRPTTYLEIFAKKNVVKIDGEAVLKKGNLTLYKVSEKLFVIDYISWDIVGQATKKKKWFFEIFGSGHLKDFTKDCLEFLGIKDYVIFSENIFSYQFIENHQETKSVFDAWDNFLQFPDNEMIKDSLKIAYQSLGDHCDIWVTNSKKNIEYFTRNFKIQVPILIKNGVDFEMFQKHYPRPSDLQKINSPVVGFGGKISHLFDYDLYNFCLENNPDKNFVIVGQILDKSVFEKIKKTPNFHYLGDKHYKDYPAYVCNFDLGIIPYVNNHLDSGADSIKAYEYLAAGLNSIGSKGAGMTDLSEYMHIADSYESFSKLIDKTDKVKAPKNLPISHSWEYKTEALIEIFGDILHNKVG